MADVMGAARMNKLWMRSCSWRSTLVSLRRVNRVDRQEDGGDRHRRTTMPAGERWRNLSGSLCLDGGGGRRYMQQCARQRQVGLASGVGKDPVVPDPVETCGQDMQQEAAHELANVERHRLVHRVPR